MKPFEVNWSFDQMDAIRRRMLDVELPSAPAGSGWTLGCDRDFLENFRSFFVEEYDWQNAVALLNRFPQFTVELDGLDIHFVHITGEGAARRPLLLTHGWPGSHYEFWGAAERLAFPSPFGGRAEDALDLVIPSLPGFGFSGKPAQPIGLARTAAMWDRLMTEVLGYPAYLAQGGDWGCAVTSMLGLHHGSSVRGIHLNAMGLFSTAPPQNDAEREWMQGSEAARAVLGGYMMLQFAKPQSLAWATASNPLGQAAWILERFHDWADLGEDGIEDVFGLDHLATNFMIYTATDSFPTALLFYNGYFREPVNVLPEGVRCETPTGFAAYPGDALLRKPPRSRVELIYNLVHWSEPSRGGHFAAMEQPILFSEDVLSWSSKVWPMN